MDNFMSKYRNQKDLWTKLVEILKRNKQLSEEIRVNLTPINAQNKFMALTHKFKALFYKTLKPSADAGDLFSFQYYDVSESIFPSSIQEIVKLFS